MERRREGEGRGGTWEGGNGGGKKENKRGRTHGMGG